MGRPNVQYSKDQLADFCQRNHIRKLALFGSVLRGDFRSDSDVDILVEFMPGHVPGLAIIRMQDELSTIFGGHRIDLVTPKFLNHRIRDRVLSEAQIEYAEG